MEMGEEYKILREKDNRLRLLVGNHLLGFESTISYIPP